MTFDRNTWRITEPGRFGRISLVVGIIGIAVSFLGLMGSREQFFISWLTAFTFWVTLGFGGLFFVLVHHMTAATWSVVVRRIGEALMMTLPLLALLALPLLLGMDVLWRWSVPEYVAGDKLLEAKQGYLNVPFFVVRIFIYFAVWSLLAWRLRKVSLAQETGWSLEARKRFQRISAPGLILFAFTVTFAGFDWVMSLEPHWYSTIYGLWWFSGGIVSVMAFIGLVVYFLTRNGTLEGIVTAEHRHDIAKLLYAYMIFWAYMHLSQYLLIWYANLPEETLFFKMRWVGSWKIFSWVIVIGGFTIPFLLMMNRGTKRNPAALAFWAIWLLVMHWVDLYWNIVPNFHKAGMVFSWMDLTMFVGMGGVVLWLFWRSYTSAPIVPTTDPKLEESLQFVNH